MPTVIFHKGGQTYRDEVRDNTNLVVRAGIKQFPYPHLRYECGMGKCSKEKRQLGERLEAGYRLACQLWLSHDIELVQDDAVPA